MLQNTPAQALLCIPRGQPRTLLETLDGIPWRDDLLTDVLGNWKVLPGTGLRPKQA